MAGVCKENNTAKNIDGVGVGSGEGRWEGELGLGVGVTWVHGDGEA